jgi:hypothetical protein
VCAADGWGGRVGANDNGSVGRPGTPASEGARGPSPSIGLGVPSLFVVPFVKLALFLSD